MQIADTRAASAVNPSQQERRSRIGRWLDSDRSVQQDPAVRCSQIKGGDGLRSTCTIISPERASSAPSSDSRRPRKGQMHDAADNHNLYRSPPNRAPRRIHSRESPEPLPPMCQRMEAIPDLGQPDLNLDHHRHHHNTSRTQPQHQKLHLPRPGKPNGAHPPRSDRPAHRLHVPTSRLCLPHLDPEPKANPHSDRPRPAL